MADLAVILEGSMYSQHMFFHSESVVRGFHREGLHLYEVSSELLYHKVFKIFFLNIGLHSKEASGKEYFVAP